MDGILMYFLIGLAIFFFMVTCIYVCNGFKVTSPHNRRKPENIQRPRVFIIATRTVPSNSSRTNVISENSSSDSLPTSLTATAPPPDYTTVDMHAPSRSRHQEAETCIPPPSYDEAIKMEQ